MATFTWVPQWGTECSEEPLVRKAQFGDGYQQRQPAGLNNDLEKWTVTFKEAPETITLIKAFLKARGGVEAFTWVTPEGRSSSFICSSWRKQEDDYGWRTITATFEEVAEKVV